MTEYDSTTRGVTLHTDRGSTVRAPWCVVATGYEVATLLPDLPIDLNSSFAFVSEPVDGLDDRYPDGLLFWEHADPYLYGRTIDDGRFLVGGRDATYRAPLRRRRALPTKARALERDIARRMPELDLEVAFEWAGTFAETPDGLAYLGGPPSCSASTARSASPVESAEGLAFRGVTRKTSRMLLGERMVLR